MGDIVDMQEKKEDAILLKSVVKKITRLGYDIEDNPFSLTKYN